MLKKQADWLRDFLKDEPYKHTAIEGIIYNLLLDGTLRNKVITNIINYLFEQCQITEEISYIRYCRVNKKSVIKDKDKFNRLNVSDNQIIILIPFTDLDVKVETKIKKNSVYSTQDRNDSLLRQTAHVHLYQKRHEIQISRKHRTY